MGDWKSCLDFGHSPLMLLQPFKFSKPFIIQVHRIIIIKVGLELVVIQQLRPHFTLNVIMGSFVFSGDCCKPVIKDHMELGRHMSS